MPVKVDYAVRESVTNMRRNLFMTLAAVMVVAVSVFLSGGALLVRDAVSRTAEIATANVSVTVFLSNGIPRIQREAIEDELRAIEEVSEVHFESQEEAYENFKQLFADKPELVRATRPEFLPASFRVRLHSPREFTVVKERLEGRPWIEKIRDEREIVARLFRATDFFKFGALVIAALVVVAGLLLIATTIRMAIYARRKEIQIQKLVGATNWFIRVPFIMEGVVVGFAGALVACLLLVAAKPLLSGFSASTGLTDQLRLNIGYAHILIHAALLLPAGALVGAVGSLFGLRRFLDV